MRLSVSLCAALTLAASVAPGFAMADEPRVRLAQAAPASPPTSGWNVPSATPQAAPAPPSTGWGSPSAPASNSAAAAPGQPSGSWSGPAAGSGRNCMGEIKPLLSEAEEKGKAIKAAAATKKQPVVCQAFKNLAAAEGKLIKYFDDHGTECGIPPDAMKARRGNYAKIVEVRTKVCDTAAAPAPRAPSLSDALGTSRIPSIPSDTAPAAKKGSTFDTLTGNSLTR